MTSVNQYNDHSNYPLAIDWYVVNDAIDGGAANASDPLFIEYALFHLINAAASCERSLNKAVVLAGEPSQNHFAEYIAEGGEWRGSVKFGIDTSEIRITGPGS